MSVPSSSVEPETAADRQAGDAHYYRQVLHELIDIGAELARLVLQQAKAQAEAAVPAVEPAPDATAAFDRTSRAIRRTIMLARTLDEPVPARAPGDPAQARVIARKRIIRTVEDAIQREAGGEQAGALHAELNERMDGPDLDDEIAERAVTDIIADICRDLGLGAMPGTRPWKRRTPDDVAALYARAAKPAAASISAGVARAMPSASRAGSESSLRGGARFRGSG